MACDMHGPLLCNLGNAKHQSDSSSRALDLWRCVIYSAERHVNCTGPEERDPPFERHTMKGRGYVFYPVRRILTPRSHN